MTDTEIEDIDGRLRDLRQATRGRVRPSPDLYAGLIESLEVRTARRWPKVVAALAAVIVAVVALRPQPNGPDDVVSTRPLTRAAFVAVMTSSCQDLITSWKPRPRPGIATIGPPYKVLDFHTEALAGFLDRIRAIPEPPEAQPLMEEVERNVVAAHAAAQAYVTSFDGPEIASQAGSDMRDAIDRVGAMLVDFGVGECRQLYARMSINYMYPELRGSTP